jgi:hypothetical protein
MLDEKVRIGKAAEILGVTVQTLRNWEKAGKLCSSRSPGGQRYYMLCDLQRYMLDIETLGWHGQRALSRQKFQMSITADGMIVL